MSFFGKGPLDILTGGSSRNPLDILTGGSGGSPFGSGQSNPFNPFSSNEKRDETKRMIRDAKELVAEGKEIISDAESSMNRARSDAETAIHNYSSLCRTVSRRLGDEVIPTIQRFNDFNVDAKVVAPKIGTTSIPNINIPTSSFIGNPMPVPSILDIFLDEYQYDKAKEQYEAAKAYRDEARAARERMRTVRDQMRQIEHELNANGTQISDLSDKVISLTSQLKDAMSQSAFTQEQAGYLKSISKIASMICQHLSTTFLNNDSTINRTFQRQAATMKKLNEAIPMSPRVDDQRLLFAIRELSNIPLET